MTARNENSISASVSWLVFAKFTGFVFSLLLPLIVVRILTKSDVGIYQQVFLVITTVSAVLPFGISMSAYYFLAREKERAACYIFNILLFNFTVGGIACLTLWLRPDILSGLFKDEIMAEYAPRIGLVIWLWIFSAFLETVAIANREARLATVFIVSSQFTKSFFLVLAVSVFGSVGSMLNAITVQAALQTLILFVYLRRRFPGFWKSFDATLFRQHLRYALPFGFAGVLWTMQTELHNYFIGNRFSPEEVAVYRAGCFELPLLALLYESITSVLIPRMSELQSQGKTREMIELTARAVCKLSLFYFPAFVFFIVTAETFITTLFTKNFADSVPIFLINICLLPAYVIVSDPLVRSYESLGNYILKVRIFIVTALIAVLYFGRESLSLRSMITVVVMTSLTDRVITTVRTWRTVGVKFSDIGLLKNVARTAVVAVVAGLVTFVVYQFVKGYADVWDEALSGYMKPTMAHFLAGCAVLGISASAFAATYLTGAHYLDLIDETERRLVTDQIIRIKRILGFAATAG